MPHVLPNFLSVVVAGSAPALLVFLYWALLTPTVTAAVLGYCNPFYTVSFTVHAGIACLVLCLHARIACLAFLACDWLLLIGVYPKVSVISLALIGDYLWSVP